ncbi:MAG: hypothetical protein ACD_9C00178G0002 [uncultured bacterium]|nr:MAG: hypothetical protein ACD_9C00178G0002 [uncultured bacterium]
MDEKISSNFNQLGQPKYVIIILGMLVVGAICIVSILRDRIVNPPNNQVSVIGHGKVAYQPDTATVTLGVQIDKAPTAQDALNQLNEKITRIVSAMESLGIKKEDVQTQAYTLYPQYDYRDNVSNVSGYNANQKISIKASNVQQDRELISKIISLASEAGTNQVTGIDFSVSNMNDLKQQARILAINDAKSKSADLAEASGVKIGKIVNWYENVVQSPGEPQPMGYGGSDMAVSKEASSPQVPTGTQEIIMEIVLNYSVR